MTAAQVSAIRASTPRVAVPAIQAKTWVTGSIPASANTAMKASALIDWVSEATCGDRCRGWLRPQAAGSAPPLPSAKK